MWKQGNQATIGLKFVQRLKAKFTPNGRMKYILKNIELLFSNEVSAISVIGNIDLNQQLQKLISLLSSGTLKGSESRFPASFMESILS